jgi:hypothetical protein
MTLNGSGTTPPENAAQAAPSQASEGAACAISHPDNDQAA